ncbi:MAG: Uncharacterised protein [Rhodospirillaceae bacterium]|nr:ABC transporter substrate-binding protein [Rhodospirillaceae bacterium]CAI8321137.1 MAG: Uncharacterised protein [Rhodospirillaceae bacterium]
MTKLRFTRRNVLRTGVAGGAAVAAGSLFMPAVHAQASTKIGYVTPATGPLAGFAEADDFVIGNIRDMFASKGVEIVVKDTQSSPARAAEVTQELIAEGVSMVLVASTPETTNPTASVCEANQVPCISSVAPWQPYFFGQGGDPATGFNYSYHFFWGLEDLMAVFAGMWNQLDTNKKVGGLFPNDGDGNAWGGAFPGFFGAQGFEIVDPGRYENLNSDFSSQISAFQSAGVDILTGVPIPPDFTTFWKQALAQGMKPKAASIGKAILFPVAVEALGNDGHNLSSEVWWTPSHPFTDSLLGLSAADVAGAYTSATGRQWTQPIGFVHALFEVADRVMETAGTGADDVAEALSTLSMDTVVGPVDWTSGPVKNVSKTPLVGGQWRGDGNGKYDMVITENALASNIALQGSMEPIFG